MLVGRRIKQESRILRRPRRKDDDARLLHLFLFLRVVIFDAGDAAAVLIGEDARHGRQRAHLGTGFARLTEIGHHRVGERADRAADVAPAVIDASRSALEFRRIHSDRVGHKVDAVGLGGLEPHFAVREGLHRRHRVGLSGRPPFFLGLGIARHADLFRHFVVKRRDVFVSDRPIVRAIVLAFDLEVGRQIAREIGEVVQRRAADAPAGLADIAERIFAFEQYRRPGRLDAPAPDVGRDQIGKLPVRAVVEQHDLLAGLGEHVGKYRARGTGADNDDVDFFVAHVTTSWPVRCGACRARRARHSRPSWHRSRRLHRRVKCRRRRARADLASRRACSAASG